MAYTFSDSTGTYSCTYVTPAVWCHCGRVGPAYGVVPGTLSCGPACALPSAVPLRRSLRWRVVDAVDEWAHRRGLKTLNARAYGWWKLTPFAWLCNYRERSYGGPPS